MQVSSYIFQTPYSQPMQVGRPDPAMIKEQTQNTQEQLDQQQKNSTEIVGAKSEQEQTDVFIKSSAMYQNDESYSATALSLQDYKSISKEAQRSQNITAYVNNSGNTSTEG
ncbi:hypothetical protein [Sulfuricurvum sp. RIFCSPLOWO2_12_FULL_43_24]|uniref:hypothetical protein n=1 Tax=Sulfuricurvum sp. RIFCSPLOWO2_12_FULL_43_24 TaxID=1802247 RepID=UPI0008B4C066|nr:hypothetical protein [Sulfuricurvum sp. RIFCSPLOWO2_12_FULL_43_24]OHD79891.1 MAG: hypothetical protein A3D90_09435 [Sulfuricurvum sp. RIFCSPHIGHO2_02_FULL_43_9]OHD85938.1 MAG: hypothetical protein A3I60_07605 [Sulfuricurvum sp. RIFCSPLOWO2_02_FULL_43_45]OHD87252.1 MAG: hypothetical protein A2W83_06650 [Sulfuricurvum sp. RIFCSPLOWO2_12_43_5]OHD87609.1 MAG: hypothetical protein A3J39_04945 [Sulfuricurvum sp. RIFCSPHIGHO2_12_FULL_44_8]OHD87830.1 MAG: hypothetical protein A2Y52_03305 [Sulfuricu